MNQMSYLRQNIEALGFRGLDFGEFLAEIFDKDFLEAPGDGDGLLSDNLEDLV